VLLGEPEWRALGYQDPADWLDDITKESAVEVEAPDPLVSDGRSGILRVKRMALAVGPPVVGSEQNIQDNLRAADSADEEDVPEHGVRRDDRNADPNARDAIEVALRDMLRRAEERGAGKKTMTRLTKIVFRYHQDDFRLELGHDPPADVEPIVIELVEGLDTG
jgi:hypothetical protein